MFPEESSTHSKKLRDLETRPMAKAREKFHRRAEIITMETKEVHSKFRLFHNGVD